MADLVRWWPLTTASAHARVVALLMAVDGSAALSQPLGRHHQRLLALHRSWVGSVLDALVTCRHCGVDNEFPVPVAEVLALPAPGPEHVVDVTVAGAGTTFRLPTVEDLSTTSGAAYADAVRAVAARTCLIRPVPTLDDAEVRTLAAAWEDADPAAAISVDFPCVSCDAALSAAVDPAEFVARDLDRQVERLLGDVHAIASAYGWSEDAILSLPEGRRRRYLGLVDARPNGRSLSLATP
jgi:hypothetical protein